MRLLSAIKPRLFCPGLTRHGHPRHVLYLPGDTNLTPYGGGAAKAGPAGGGDGYS